jgi:protein ImuA
MRASADRLLALRRSIAAIERRPPPGAPKALGLGPEGLDRRLGGGLARGRLHEIFAAEPEDASAAAGFALMLALRARTARRSIWWVRQELAERRTGRLHAPGLLELGADPAGLVLAIAPDDMALLRAAADIVRCHEVGAAVIEIWGKPRTLDLTASRRLAVAAGKSGVTAFLLRAGAMPAPSAADTRWQVRAAASAALEAGAPGHATLEISLLRHRAGLAGLVQRVEWDRERLRLREPPLLGAVVSLPAGRPAAAGEGNGSGIGAWRRSA